MATVASEEDIFLIQDDINNYINTQQSLYNKLKSSEYVLDIDKETNTNDSNVITSENISNKMQELSDLSDDIEKEKQLQELINSYFNRNYNYNTKLRKQYFEKINSLNQKLLLQNKELGKLKPELKSLETRTSTQFRKLKDIKRLYSEQKYYVNLYQIISFIQLLILIILIIGIYNVMPKNTVIIIITILYLLLSLYVGYVVLFTNTDRDVMVFDKYKFPVDKDAVSKCDTSELSKKSKEQENEIQYKLTELLDKRQSKTQCLINPESTTTTTPVTTTTETTTPVTTITETTTPVTTTPVTTTPVTTTTETINS
jgi:hypothetical protein